jgi:hypothetical protein
MKSFLGRFCPFPLPADWSDETAFFGRFLAVGAWGASVTFDLALATSQT